MEVEVKEQLSSIDKNVTTLSEKANSAEKEAKAATTEAKAAKEAADAAKKTAEETKAAVDTLTDTVTKNQTVIDKVSTVLANGSFASGSGDKPKSFGLHIASSMSEVKDAIAQMAAGKSKGFKHALSEKAVGDITTATNLGGGAIPITYRNEIVPLPFEMVHFRNLVAVTPSATDSYHFYRHVLGEGSIDWQGGENNVKQQIDEDLNEVTVNLDYLAGWLRISKKMLKNFSALQSYLSRWLPERYYQAEDAKAYAALKASATGVPAATGNVLDRIIMTMGAQKQAKYGVNAIVVNGNTWAQILTLKATGSGEYNTPGVVSISPAGQILILGVPVFTASWVEDDIAIVGDWRMFEIIQSEALSLNFYDQDGTNARENKVTALIEASIGFADLQPKAFAFVDVTPAP